ncbi:oxidoreductase [Streptomyces sp. DSM 40750]|uniref:oxidoreductase n=1 Tax=Streptomyces sp. DSM 40750 TaxID=2801030 RepID=UPI00214C5EAF|nr:oxidoreductase [Streptomyces sp. DSM 40750]UUU23894.1 oxidoreductase [Streptomyces sp. DSM 40750]
MTNKTNQWSATRIPDLTGRTAVVTGANSGIGLSAVDALARAGAHVVLAVRDPRRGEAAAATVSGARGTVEVRPLDLADLASVRRFADGWQGDLDLLINNAGVMNLPEGTTKDGFETQFGTNHLGHFALTNLLLPHVTDRVVTVASNAHKPGRIHFENLNLTGEYQPLTAYAQSKLANLLFTLELQRRLGLAGSPVRAMAAHPGLSSTHLGDHGANVLYRAGARLGGLLAQDSVAGSLPTLYAAVMDLPGASYVGPDGLGGWRGSPTLVGRSPQASDPETASRLWTVSEELTGVTFPEQLSPTTEPTTENNQREAISR